MNQEIAHFYANFVHIFPKQRLFPDSPIIINSASNGETRVWIWPPVPEAWPFSHECQMFTIDAVKLGNHASTKQQAGPQVLNQTPFPGRVLSH
jgi:hypothetical protein